MLIGLYRLKYPWKMIKEKMINCKIKMKNLKILLPWTQFKVLPWCCHTYSTLKDTGWWCLPAELSGYKAAVCGRTQQR